MSNSPAQPPSGLNSVTPTTGGPAAPIVRKRPAVNIFNTSSKKKPIRKPAPAGSKPAAAPTTTQISNGQPLGSYQQPINGTTNHIPAPAAPTDEPDPSTYNEYPIMITKSQLSQGMRYHAMKLQSKLGKNGQPIEVNPYDQNQFPRPARLHRRYARDKMESLEQSEVGSGVDDKEREQMNARRAERQAEREENQKLIAPTGGESNRPQKKKMQKKVEEGRDESNPVRQKRSQLRYEEARPWHLEDYEGKNVWVGSYEEALSERSIMLVVSNDGTFEMVPVEKWYKFQQTNKVNAMDSEQVEKFMMMKHVPSRWALGTQKGNEQASQSRIRALRASRDDEDMRRESTGDFDADRDMLDLDVKDEFQDDDEGMLFQGEDGEDGDEIERRIYLEMRDAGLGGTGVKNEDQDVEGEHHRDQLQRLAEKKKQKKLRKQLRKREHQGQYSDDSDSDPYAESSDSMDSEEEAEEEKRKAEEEKKKAIVNGDKSGASTKGTNTPTGRPEKRDPTRLGANLKRPGSPDASDLSGNESSRKKVKSINGRPVSAAPSAARAISSTGVPKAKVSRVGGSGSGSDTDTSKTGRLKLKLKNSPPGSPSAATPNGSRAGSPTASGTATPNGGTPFPTLDEVRASIPPAGIAMKALVAKFKSRVGTRTADFIALVKKAGQLSKDKDKIGLIELKPGV
ncbi:putative transcription initiation factor IIF, alpha subunit [Septoria linicola]|nr:putative transcription initiation factor IIF, alpha subunit [Septoria linicola]